MSLREEFVGLAQQADANISALCRRYGISRKTGYKWLHRTLGSCADRSRRPHHSPERTATEIETVLLHLRDRFPDWGARKLKRYLHNRGHVALPAVSTITAVLQRHGRITPKASDAAQHWQRFEHAQSNALWQMDFKGHVAMTQGRCHPLTVLDDHSRFNLVLHACAGEALQDVQPPLIASFRRYGMPARISCDNGPPWGTGRREDGLTRLSAWLIRLGVRVSHARAYHPQTNGKDERFHRTLKSGLLARRILQDLDDAQRAFDAFRDLYNHDRPHQSLDLDVPISRYRPSERPFPEMLPPIDYAPGLSVRCVDACGRISFRGRSFRIAKALHGQRVAMQPHPERDGQHTVYYCHQPIRTIDFNANDVE